MPKPKQPEPRGIIGTPPIPREMIGHLCELEAESARIAHMIREARELALHQKLPLKVVQVQGWLDAIRMLAASVGELVDDGE